MNRREFLFPSKQGRSASPINEPLQTQSNDLTPYAGPWDDAHLHHLLRRSMFGVPPAQFQAAKALGSMSAVVAKLLECADLSKVPLPAQPAPYITDFYIPNRQKDSQATITNTGRQDNTRTQELVNWWFDLICKENLSIREKMTLFWTNHFVTGSTIVNSTAYMYTYLQTCRANALGNFKTFAQTISTDPAMLVYLNGNQNYVTGTGKNQKSFINENFAREVMELFTLGLNDPKTGLPNYTETDIQNSARALTGWRPTQAAPFIGVLNDGTNGTLSLHDTGSKTFLGQTGNWGLPDIINIIFEQGTPAGYTPAYFICSELYANFVYYVPNPTVVDAMATLMLANNFDIASVMSALLMSDHFYDASVIGAQLKSPAEYMGSLVREFGLTYPAWDATDPQPPAGIDTTTTLTTYKDTNPSISIMTTVMMANALGQALLNPPNVKGWPGAHNWISTGTFQNRENYTIGILNNSYTNAKQGWALGFNPDTYANQIANAGGISAELLSQALEDTSLGFTLGPLESGDLDKDIQGVYKNPNYQYNTGGVKAFALYLAGLPEFQLL